jgi:Na+/proline symporter
MTASLILTCIIVYFLALIAISYFTTRKLSASSYFNGDKSSPWYVIAFGMLGDSLSGVTFISVPGAVLLAKFGYFQLVMGYMVGYLAIIFILLPIYYRMNLTSIYSYLFERFGIYTQYTGAFFFMLSRILGSAARLYLDATVLQLFIFDSYGVPFAVSVSIIILLIWLYTIRGGIKTLVWTDTFQSMLLILGVVFSVVAICGNLNISWSEAYRIVQNDSRSQIFFWDIWDKSNFYKQFFGGAFIALCMTGLDQNMMQKNLTCKSLGESQKNLFWFSIIMLITNLFFLSLGVLLYYFAEQKGISLPLKSDGNVFTDNVFPYLALNHLGFLASISFVVGLTAATFSSADSVLTTLTTSFYIDILGKKTDSQTDTKLRHAIHIGFAVILLIAILIIKAVNTGSVIDIVLRIANFTYGPLLGLFMFGIFSKRMVKDSIVPILCIIVPFITFYLDSHPFQILGKDFLFGNTILIVNGFLTFIGLLIIHYLFWDKKVKSD